MSNYARRVDNTHAEIRDTLRVSGYNVTDLSSVGKGIPDLMVVSKAGVTVMLEVKSSQTCKLTERELEFANHYSHPLHIVWTVEMALRYMEGYDA